MHVNFEMSPATVLDMQVDRQKLSEAKQAVENQFTEVSGTSPDLEKPSASKYQVGPAMQMVM